MTIETTAAGIVTGTGTYIDGAIYEGPAEFEAEHGETFEAFMGRLAETEPVGSEPAEFFVGIRKSR